MRRLDGILNSAAGLEFGKDNVRLGLNYNLEAGAHSTQHGVFATFRYEF